MAESAYSQPESGRRAVAAHAHWLWPFWRAGAVTLVFFALAQGLAMLRGDHVFASITAYLRLLMAFAPLAAVPWIIWRIFRLMLVVRPASPLRAFAADLQDLLLSPARWRTGLPFLTILLLLTTSYTYFKTNIPALHPFAWDRTFLELDLWLHGGRHPWEWLQPVLGHAPVTTFINLIYNLWFVVMFGTWLCLALTRAPHVPRQRYLMAFVLTWAIGGGLLALVFSSAGPCYYAHVVPGPDPYAPLMAYLAQVDASGWPVWALGTQDMLWQSYTGNGGVSGISAMPSMHVATATLLLTVAWRFGRLPRVLAAAYFTCIVLGSVHLGWHYAVDAYLGMAIAITAWYAAGRLLGRWDDAAPRHTAKTA